MAQTFIRSLPITDNKENAWKNNVVSGINSRGIIAGTGINVQHSPNGVSISVSNREEKYPITYAGDYDFKKEYYPNTIVRVTIDQTFKNQDGNTIPFGIRTDLPFDVIPASSIIPIASGMFICSAYVPPSVCDETYLVNLIQPQYSRGVPFQIVNSTRFYDFNVYYPVSPEMKNTDMENVISTHGFALVANQNFWRMLGSSGGGSGCQCRYH